MVDLLNQFRFEDFADKPPKIQRWLEHPETFTAADAAPYVTSGINAFALGSGPGDYESGLRFFARRNSFLAAHPHLLLRIGSTADIERAHGTRRVGVMLTLQDFTNFRTPRDVDEFIGLGQGSRNSHTTSTTVSAAASSSAATAGFRSSAARS
jgi:hypothetical protein